MRIRKHAAKLLLGSACPPQYHSPPRPPTPPPPADDQSAAVADGLFLCQLNSSPWDVTDFNSFCFHQEGGGGGEEGMGGIMGNAIGLGDEEGILGISDAFTSGVAVGEPFFHCEDDDEDGSDPNKKVKKRRGRKKKKKEKENGEDEAEEKTSSVATVIAKSGGGGGQVTGICKKNDGKGWHCNRPANPYHTLCDHHLTQLKSYSSARYNNSSSNNGAAREEAEAAADVRHAASVSDLTRVVKKDAGVTRVKASRRPKTKAAAAAAAISTSAGDGYDYYSGFGLQRGKNRSNGGGKEGLAGKNESESGDGSDAPIAGDDLDDDDTDVEEDVKTVGNVDSNNSKGRIRRKKRGRKPIKARSLKSLL